MNSSMNNSYNFEVDREREIAVRKYVRGSKKYTFQKMMTEHNLWINPRDAGRQIVLSCPFHPDSTPSFYVNEEMGYCNCLACEAGGDYLKFLTYLHKKMFKSGLNYYIVAQNILASDPEMQVSLGFSSIFKRSEFKKNTAVPAKKKFKKPSGEVIHDLSDLSAWMRKSGNASKEMITLASLYMQQGYDAKRIYAELSNEQVAASAEGSSVSLLEALDWSSIE